MPNKASKSYKNGPESFFLKNRFRAGILSTNCLIYFFTIFTSNVLLSKLPLVSYASDFTSPTPLAYHSVTRSVVVFSTILCAAGKKSSRSQTSGCSADGFISHVSCTRHIHFILQHIANYLIRAVRNTLTTFSTVFDSK